MLTPDAQAEDCTAFGRGPRSVMAKLCIFVGCIVFSLLFGWGSDALGASFFVSFLVSGVGSVIGCWAGWELWRRFFQ